jgi:Fe-S cluster biogenesis protein NfuA
MIGGKVMVDKQAVQQVFERVKPLFVEHQGDFQVQNITDDGVVLVKLIGECQLCIYKEKTRRAIETMLKNEVPGVESVEIE